MHVDYIRPISHVLRSQQSIYFQHMLQAYAKYVLGDLEEPRYVKQTSAFDMSNVRCRVKCSIAFDFRCVYWYQISKQPSAIKGSACPERID